MLHKNHTVYRKSVVTGGCYQHVKGRKTCFVMPFSSSCYEVLE